MRVLQINAVYEKLSTGRTTKELHEAMLENGIESYVACPELNGLSTNAYQIGNCFDRKVHAAASRILGTQGYFSYIATQGLIRYIRKIKPDVIHLGNLHGNYIHLPMLLSFIAKENIATVLTLHDCWFFTGKCVYYIECGCNRWMDSCGKCPALKSGNPSLFLDRSRKMLSDKKRLFGGIPRLAVIGVSQWVTDDAAKSILQNASIIKCIYNWIDLEQFKPQNCETLRSSLTLTEKFVILGVSAFWSEAKGIVVFQELAAMLPADCKIVLVGDASAINPKHPEIQFLGPVSDLNTLAELYAMADVFMNPSIQETFGKTTAEAMACGTPVVAYNATATPELLGTDETCGYLVDRNDASVYLEKILEIRHRSKAAFSANTRARAELLFSKDRNVRQYFEVYNQLLTEK